MGGLEGALGKTRLAHMQNVVTAPQMLLLAAVPVCLERRKIKVNSGDFSLAGKEREREIEGREEGICCKMLGGEDTGGGGASE